MIQAIIVALIGVGLYLILADAMRIPLLSTICSISVMVSGGSTRAKRT